MNVRGLVLLVTLSGGGCGAPSAPDAATPSAASPGGASSNAEDGASSVAPSTEASVPASKGPRPPDFELDSLDGGSVRLSDHLGKDVVLIDFWATYCDPCLAAMPHLNQLYRAHQSRGFVVLGVSIDGPESIAQVRTTVAKLGVEFPILLDDDSNVVSKYNPKLSAPFSVLIGRDGAVLRKREGYTTGKAAELDRDVEAALGLGSP